MTNQVTTVSMKFEEMERLAEYMAKSSLFGIKTKEQAISLMALSQAEGLHPAIAARDYHIVQGRPTLKADAMMARFQQAGGKVEWKDYTDEKVTGIFSHPQGGKVEITWTIGMAKNANLTGKDVWRTYPRQMLRARTISEGIRTIYPGVAVGIYVPEEVEEMVDITLEAKSIFKNSTLRNNWFKSVVESFESSATLKELNAAVQGHKPKFDEMVNNGNEYDVLAVDELRKRFEQIKARIKEELEINQDAKYLDEKFESAITVDNAPIQEPQKAEIPSWVTETPAESSPSVVGAGVVQGGSLSKTDSAKPPAPKAPNPPKVSVPIVNNLPDWEGWVALLQEKELTQLKTKRDVALLRKKYESQISNLAKADNALFFQLESALQRAST